MSVRQATFEEVKKLIATSHLPVLVDFSASWCSPCRDMASSLSKLLEAQRNQIVVCSIDVDEYPEVKEEFSVRGIPTVALLRDSKEISRVIGAKSVSQLVSWLNAHGLNLAIVGRTAGIEQKWEAFYNDDGLRTFLLERMKQAASIGNILLSHLPFWKNGGGSPSASLVRSGDPVTFQKMTCLPISFGSVMEFSGLTETQDIERVFDRIPAGVNLEAVAPLLLLQWFVRNETLWDAYLQDTEVKELQLLWREALSMRLSNEPVSADRWSAINQQAKKLSVTRSGIVADGIITTILLTSPLPEPDDVSAWMTALAQHGTWSRHAVLQIEAGWTKKDHRIFEERVSWFDKNVPRLPDGDVDRSQISRYRDIWTEENADLAEKEADLNIRLHERSRAICEEIQNLLVNVLKQLQDFDRRG